MAKYDDQVNRMLALMEDSNKPKKVSSNLWYHANGADGKVYGIVKEGAKFYIKRTENGKENLVESYEYLNGFVNRREQEYKSYNDATKHLELKLMSPNEAYGKKGDVSTVDFKRNEKALSFLTEEARKELDRMNQIIENCEKIGPNNTCDPESKGKATPENTTKNNDPFTDKVTPDMDYKGSKGTVEESGDGSKVADVSSDLQSDKMKTKNSNLDDKGNDKEYKKTEDDLEGESVAAQNPKDAKAVIAKVNEGMFEGDEDEMGFNGDLDAVGGEETGSFDDPTGETQVEYDPQTELGNYGDPAAISDEAPVDDITPSSFEDGSEPVDADYSATPEVGNDIVGDEGAEGVPGEEDDLDSLLEAFLKEEDLVAGDNKVMTHEGNPINGTNNGVDGETGEDWKRVGDKVDIKEEDGYGETDKSENTETMDNYKFGYNKEKKLPAQSWDKMSVNEKKMVNKLVDRIYESLVSGSRKKMTLEEKIQKMVNEEITRLNVWGKHPKFGKEPMTHPEAKEVMAGTADRDWNDDSAKGSERYGKKIGDGKPFNKEVVDLLTDQVLAKIKGQN